MVQGLAFLSKKGFNPQNNDNRKRVWEAQQASKQEQERVRKREAQLKREKEEEELEESLKGRLGGQQAQLRFMYDAPPGLKKTSNDDDATAEGDGDKKHSAKTKESDDPSHLNRLAQADTGDDAAAAAFRQMLAGSVQNQNDQAGGVFDGENNTTPAEKAFKFAPVLQGSSVDAISQTGKGGAGGANMDGRSALEKAVGRKDRSSQNLSYQQQIERFPQLKNAPIAQSMKKVAAGSDGDGDGAVSAPMMINFKPLGAQILHVRCLACGIWGHQRGDRECAKSGWNPFAVPSQASKESSASADLNTSISSILPDKKLPNASSAIDSSKRSSQHRRRHNDASDSDRDRKRRHRRHRHHKRSRRKHTDDKSRSSDESSDSEKSFSSVPSSEDSRKMKRREDHEISVATDIDDKRKREVDERKLRHKSAKKKRAKCKHERSESSRRKKKRHKHSTRSYDSE
jgi:hypothetical protein